MSDILREIEEEWRHHRGAAVENVVPNSRRSAVEEEIFKRAGGGSGSPAGRFSLPRLLSVPSTPSVGSRPTAVPEARPKRERLEAVAKGSQPAVVKMASYGGGGALALYESEVKKELFA